MADPVEPDAKVLGEVAEWAAVTHPDPNVRALLRRLLDRGEGAIAARREPSGYFRILVHDPTLGGPEADASWRVVGETTVPAELN